MSLWHMSSKELESIQLLHYKEKIKGIQIKLVGCARFVST